MVAREMAISGSYGAPELVELVTTISVELENAICGNVVPLSNTGNGDRYSSVEGVGVTPLLLAKVAARRHSSHSWMSPTSAVTVTLDSIGVATVKANTNSSMTMLTDCRCLPP